MKKLLLLGMAALGFSAAAQISVNEGFESTTFPGTGWSTPSAAPFTRVTTTGYACSGTASARRNIYGSGTYNTSNLIYSSTASNGNAIAVSFKYVVKPYSSSSAIDGNFVVEYSSNGGASWMPIGTSVAFTADVSCATFTGNIAAGAVPTGADFKFRITGNNSTTNSSADWYLAIDDVVLSQVTSCYTPANPTISSYTSTSLGVSWSAAQVAPSSGYDIYYSTSPTAPTLATVPNITNVTGTSTTINNLTANQTYYVWVRSHCTGNDVTAWAGPATGFTSNYCVPNNTPSSYYVSGITTTGGLSNINYTATSYQSYVNNSATNLDVIPGGTISYTIQASSGTNYFYIWVDFNNDNDFVDAGEEVLATTSYAANTTGSLVIPASVPAGSYRMRVANSWSGIVGPCGPSTYGNHVDYTLRVITPSCWSPATVTVNNISPTSATATWTAPTTPPTNGYQVYYSTSSTAPTSATVPQLTNITTTSVVLTNLTPSTNYYVWVRGVCSTTDSGVWSQVTGFRTTCQPPTLTATGATVCLNGMATLTSTASAGAIVNWYSSATATTPLATGASYTTPPLTATTTYYASASTGAPYHVGKTGLESTANATGGSLSSYLTFTADSDFVLRTVDLFPYSSTAGTAGTVTIELRTSTGTLITSKVVNVIGQNSVASSTPQTVTLDFPIAAGASYRLGVGAWTGVTNMFRDSSGLAYPYVHPGTMSITGSDLGTSYYYYFYNWKIETGCESARQPVVATVDTSCLSTTEVAQKDGLKVYPNPFTDVVNISNVEEVKSATIYDVSGRLVKSLEKVTSQIHLGDLKSGMYVLNLEMKNGSKQAIKLIKK